MSETRKTKNRSALKTLENGGWKGTHVIMDKAYEGDETCQLVLELELLPAVPPKCNRINAREYIKDVVQKALQGRTVISSTERLSPHLLPIQQTGLRFHVIHSFRADHRRYH